ncbi:hypothetical protein KIPB_001136 [Kipferlia bialata]|uniref:Uncharacterized protein n=1 Tax=Kipferlia bialata TaxID=797122 RepID=A0A9K3GEZ8_9EUKA|nr:hypothetical protein KIPB_001136 [Kipferlia bialata]|eukprot:g1136.t1
MTLQLDVAHVPPEGLTHAEMVTVSEATPDWHWRRALDAVPDGFGEGALIRALLIPSQYGVVYALAAIGHARNTRESGRCEVIALDVHVYSLDTDTWRLIEQREGEVWPVPMHPFMYGCVDGGLFVAGGVEAYNRHIGEPGVDEEFIECRDIWRLDCETEAWERTAMTIPQEVMSCQIHCAHDRSIVVRDMVISGLCDTTIGDGMESIMEKGCVILQPTLSRPSCEFVPEMATVWPDGAETFQSCPLALTDSLLCRLDFDDDHFYGGSQDLYDTVSLERLPAVPLPDLQAFRWRHRIPDGYINYVKTLFAGLINPTTILSGVCVYSTPDTLLLDDDDDDDDLNLDNDEPRHEEREPIRVTRWLVIAVERGGPLPFP